jgi:DNA-binding CsgD family transcriptional regulator
MATPKPRSWAPPESVRLEEQVEQLARLGTWRWCPTSNDLRWSDNLFRLYGLEPEQITPSWQWVLERTHPADRARLSSGPSIQPGAGGWSAVEHRFMPPGFGVRHLRWSVAAVEQAPDEADTIWGLVQDVTERAGATFQVELQAVALRAMLAAGAFESTIERLLADLGRALESELGVLWVQRGEVLMPRVVWSDESLGPELRPAVARLRLGSGRGLAGRALAAAGPIVVSSLTDDARFEPHRVSVRAGLRAAVAFPANAGGRPLAVLGFAARSPAALELVTPATLARVGDDVGSALARRRGELEPSVLTPRELEILRLAAHGHAVHRLAAMLGISSSTVKTHLEQVYRKLGVSDRTAAVAEMMRRGMID